MFRRYGYRNLRIVPTSELQSSAASPRIRCNRGDCWNPDWRNDHRYDWRQWRERHRSTFHVGFYYDPFGYNYRQFEVGYRLTPAYFGQQYWISDPWDYQLPPPPPGAVWVRYWNDALLVDMYSGEVVDAIRNFFW